MIDIEALFRRYGPMVHRRCRSLLGDEDRAADACQEVFVRLIRTGERLEDKGLCSLLFTMATQQSLNVLRSEKSRPGYTGGELLDEIACLDDQNRLFAADLVDRIFRRHPASSRTLATLHWVDGLTLEETAEAAAMSVSGVRKRLRKLKESGQLLKEALL